MRFNLKSLGFIDKGSLKLGELTVICGPNNSGKGYVTSAIYGLMFELSCFKDFVLDDNIATKLRTDGVLHLDLEEQCAHLGAYTGLISTKFTDSLASFFNDTVGLFDEAKVELIPDGLAFALKPKFKDVITVGENSTISFYKAENSSKLEIIYAKGSDADASLPDKSLANYIKCGLNKCLITPLAHRTILLSSDRISTALLHNQADSICAAIRPLGYEHTLIGNYAQCSKQQSFLAKDPQYKGIIDTLYELMQGECVCNDDKIFFVPNPEKGRRQVKVPLHLAPSSVKSLLLFDRYIRSIAAPNDLLVIDEVEQNLDFYNQHKLGSLLARLVNAGIKVLISTHSVEMIAELNNRIMLSGEGRYTQKLMAVEGISYEEVLHKDQVKAYALTDLYELEQAKITKFGMRFIELEDAIIKTNNLNDDIYCNVLDSQYDD